MSAKAKGGIAAVVFFIIFAIIGGMVAMATMRFQKPEANEWGCSFGKGPLDERGLKNVIRPGGNGGLSNDTLKTGPSDVRFYIIDSDPGTADLGGRPIQVPARGSIDTGVGVVTVSIETQVRFVFNENFCDWYINHGRRNEPLNYAAPPGETSGWSSFLNASMNQKLIEGARPVVANESYVDLYTNAPIGDEGLAYDVLGDQLSTNLSRELERDLGGVFFCGPSYQFDGKADGELSSGCPPLEVTIKRVVPVDLTLIERLELLVSNEEQQKVIDSNRELELARIASERTQELQRISAQQDTQVAEQERRQAVETAQAQAQLAIAQTEEAVRVQELENETLQAQADAAFCAQLAAQGVDCALYEAAKSGAYPNVILGEGGDVGVLVQP
jgi:hypothetical protein